MCLEFTICLYFFGHNIDKIIMEGTKLYDVMARGYAMKIQFIGATHEVTGSCTLLEVCGKKYLVDCGME